MHVRAGGVVTDAHVQGGTALHEVRDNVAHVRVEIDTNVAQRLHVTPPPDVPSGDHAGSISQKPSKPARAPMPFTVITPLRGL